MSDKTCDNCKYSNFRGNEHPCVDCAGSNRSHWEPKYDNHISMIKSIIDEAMEKRDRTVSVFISGENMHVTVAPLGEDEPRWIEKAVDNHQSVYVCSACGEEEMLPSRYCRNCGEALKKV